MCTILSPSAGVESHLMQQWLDLVHERNILIRQTNDLSQRMKDLEIEDQLCEIERELRELDQIPGTAPAQSVHSCWWTVFA